MLEISKTKEDLYKEGCPVLIKTCGIYKQEGDLYANIVMQNISAKDIGSVSVDLHIFNKANNEIEVIRDYFYVLNAVKRDELFGQDVDIMLHDDSAFTIAVAVKKVVFTDNESWTGTNSIFFENLPRLVTLEELFEDNETIEQYQRDFSGEFATDKNAVAKVKTRGFKDLWICACTAINRDDEEVCHCCGASYLMQKELVENRIRIEGNLIRYKQSLEEQAEKEKIVALQKAEEERCLKEQAETAIKQEKEQEIIQKKKSKKKKIIISSLIILLIILAGIYLYVSDTYINPNNKYNEAVSLLDDNKFEEAIDAFEELGSFSNSPDMIIEAKFRNAEFFLDNDEFDKAIVAFEEIKNRRNVTDSINEAKYQKALVLFEEDDYSQATPLFKEIEMYKDSKEYIYEINYNLAVSNIDNLVSSSIYFERLTGEKSTLIQEMYYEKGQDLYVNGDMTKADAYFSYITDSAIIAKIDQVHYDQAIVYIEEKKYDEAVEMLNELDDFKDSKTQIDRIQYEKGLDQIKLKDYLKAIDFLSEANGYEDSDELINNCKYTIAEKHLSDGHFDLAIDAFKDLGDYKDSIEKYNYCTYKQGYKLLEESVNDSKKALEAYELLYPIKDYPKAYELLTISKILRVHVYDKGLGVKP